MDLDKMKRIFLILIMALCFCGHAESNSMNIYKECKANIESVSISIEYFGSTTFQFYKIFIHHENQKYKLKNDPFRLEYNLNTVQMNQLLDAMFQADRASYHQIMNNIENLDDFIIKIETQKTEYMLQLSKKLNRKKTFQKILLLPQNGKNPDLSIFLKNINF